MRLRGSVTRCLDYFQYLALNNNKHLTSSIRIVKFGTNVCKYSLNHTKICRMTVKCLPKSQNFAKSGHTAVRGQMCVIITQRFIIFSKVKKSFKSSDEILTDLQYSQKGHFWLSKNQFALRHLLLLTVYNNTWRIAATCVSDWQSCTLTCSFQGSSLFLL